MICLQRAIFDPCLAFRFCLKVLIPTGTGSRSSSGDDPYPELLQKVTYWPLDYHGSRPQSPSLDSKPISGSYISPSNSTLQSPGVKVENALSGPFSYQHYQPKGVFFPLNPPPFYPFDGHDTLFPGTLDHSSESQSSGSYQDESIPATPQQSSPLLGIDPSCFPFPKEYHQIFSVAPHLTLLTTSYPFPPSHLEPALTQKDINFLSGEVQEHSSPGQPLGTYLDHGHEDATSRVHGDAPLSSSLYTVDQYEETTPPKFIPTAPNQGVEKGQLPNSKWCPDCGAYFSQKQGLKRHRKDIHSAWNVCPHCFEFEWSQGRKYMFEKHLLDVHHIGDRRRARNPRRQGARRAKAPLHLPPSL
ncbi:hypothetical protein B0F90DRAFT_1895200 [Multifurca ochricompacta]|uniref:C2H2-type domain-containing protein n=1 Tax=Multifurca ochricompacta TaxID=376703 RepID=A0AAD4M734_9AGAM|nr:hypothetical protein B0F90DRAFT_1895200 [Multifurca ochricompacta]